MSYSLYAFGLFGLGADRLQACRQRGRVIAVHSKLCPPALHGLDEGPPRNQRASHFVLASLWVDASARLFDPERVKALLRLEQCSLAVFSIFDPRYLQGGSAPLLPCGQFTPLSRVVQPLARAR